MSHGIARTIIGLNPRVAFLVGLSAIAGPVVAASAPAAAVRLGVIAEDANEPDRMLRVYADLLTE